MVRYRARCRQAKWRRWPISILLWSVFFFIHWLLTSTKHSFRMTTDQSVVSSIRSRYRTQFFRLTTGIFHQLEAYWLESNSSYWSDDFVGVNIICFWMYERMNEERSHKNGHSIFTAVHCTLIDRLFIFCEIWYFAKSAKFLYFSKLIFWYYAKYHL